MSMPPIAICRTGLVSAVGLGASQSCAAFRAKVTNPSQTRFIDSAGEWIMAHQVPLAQGWRGITKLAKMAAMAIDEVLADVPLGQWAGLPLLLCVAEPERPGRMAGLDDQLLQQVQRELDVRFAPSSAVIAQGRVGIAVAFARARDLMAHAGTDRVLLAAADSLLSWPTLSHYERRDRLLTPRNPNGFMPGEGAGALLLGTAKGEAGELVCAGIGFGQEPAHIDSEEPLRAEGLSQAIRMSIQEAGCEIHDFDYRITDASGEQYYFKEAALALTRLLRVRKEEYDIWHPAECTGETGAASGAMVIANAQAACEKGYTKGPNVLVHWANDGGQRAALTLRYRVAA